MEYLFSLLDEWPRFQVRRFDEGHYRWVLLTPTDAVLARSPGSYGSSDECIRAVEAVRKAVTHAKIDVSALEKTSEKAKE